MASRAASYAGEPGKIYASSHSYGITEGWIWTDLAGTWAWHWYSQNNRVLFGLYWTITRDWDQICYDAPYYLPFIGAGNERDDNPAAGDPYYSYVIGMWFGPYPYDPETDHPGDGVYKDGYDTIGPVAIAKNVMAVGAVSAAVSGGVRDPGVASMSSFSSWGPADDGRIKPDIVGDGIDVYHPDTLNNEDYSTWGGTSSATPNASGSAILLVEYYGELFPGQVMRASTLKGLILHTADDLGNPGPDYVYGWGLMNVEAAADQIKKHHDYPAQHRIVEGLLTGADPVHSYQFVSEGTDPIRVTICWTDPPGVPTDVDDDPTPKLVNDLDLRLFGPGGAPTFYPYILDLANPSAPAMTGDNYVDNVEQVYVLAPPGAGTYTVEVSYKGTLTDGQQYYSLVVSGQGPASAGTAVLDGDGYNCTDTVEIEVTDADLRNNGTQDVTVTTSGGDSETVTLMETPAGSAVFVGSIGTSSNPVGIEDGMLQVVDGETITVTYNDADDGTGSPVAVVDTAAVECILPAISNVTTTNLTAAGARVTFDTNETASVRVRYGPACDDLSETNAGFVVGASHQVALSALLSETAYFYVVEATDAVDNTATADNGGGCYSFTTLVSVDYFTEEFNRVDNDLDYQTVTLTPDGSGEFYQACRDPATAFPTDPAGGSVFSFALDDYAQVTLSGGAQVSLYGTSYSSFYVGSNGYITFTQGDTDYWESLADHFDTARISGVFDDFNLPAGGSVSWKQLADRAVVTYENVPEYSLGSGTGSNSFQIEMFFDQTIRITWLEIDARDGLSGLSAGNGKPSDFLESDLSGYEWCSPPPDCNSNGTPDEWDIINSTSPDCNLTGVPDECEVPPIDPQGPDCNSNGTPDECELIGQPLLGYWPFDGDGGDGSGSGRDLDLYGGVGFSSGLFGQALAMLGDPTQFAARPADDDVYNFGGGDFTIQIWVNFNTTSGEQVLIEKLEGGAGPGWTLTKLSGNKLFFVGTPSIYLETPVLTIPTDMWHHVAVRRDGGSFDMIFDGAIVASISSADAIDDTNYPLLVGKRNDADGRNFTVDGGIDEVAIWAGALAPAEIARIYNGGLGLSVSDATASDADGNGILDECEAVGNPLAARYPHDRRKNRYICFNPNKAENDGINVAFKVELLSINMGSCNDGIGAQSGNVDFCRTDRGTADCKACSESGDSCISASIDCSPGESCDPTGAVCVNDLPNSGGLNVGMIWWVGPEKDTASDPNLNIHLLVSEPFRKVSTDWPNTVHAGDCEVVPQASFGVRTVAATVDPLDTEAESDELVVETTQFPPGSPPAPFWWGDVVGVLAFHCNGDIREQTCDPNTANGDCTGSGVPAACCTGAGTGLCDCSGSDPCVRAWELPNGVTNVDDVTAALWTSAPAPPTTVSADFTWVDVHGNDSFTPGSQNFDPPNNKINASDLQQIGSAFGGLPYKFYDPADCPDEPDWP